MVEFDDAPLGQVFGEVQELTERVELLKARLPKQNFKCNAGALLGTSNLAQSFRRI